jgi:hypothetical protein
MVGRWMKKIVKKGVKRIEEMLKNETILLMDDEKKMLHNETILLMGERGHGHVYQMIHHWMVHDVVRQMMGDDEKKKIARALTMLMRHYSYQALHQAMGEVEKLSM